MGLQTEGVYMNVLIKKYLSLAKSVQSPEEGPWSPSQG